MIEFIAAVYNEEDELPNLIAHVAPYVDRLNIVDDGSMDHTADYLDFVWAHEDIHLNYKVVGHTGLPETVKAEALKMCDEGSWVIMLDADERFGSRVLPEVREFLLSEQSEALDYIYSPQLEIIDDQAVRSFQKCKIFRKEAMQFPLNNIHADDVLSGNGTYRPDWVVYHRKTSEKQKTRELEYLLTYKRLLNEGKIDEGRYQWLRNLHHYVK